MRFLSWLSLVFSRPSQEWVIIVSFTPAEIIQQSKKREREREREICVRKNVAANNDWREGCN